MEVKVGSKWIEKKRPGRVVTITASDFSWVSYEAPHPNRPGYTFICHGDHDRFLQRFVPAPEVIPDPGAAFRVEMGGFFKGQDKDTIAYLKRGEDVVALFGATFKAEAQACCDMLNAAQCPKGTPTGDECLKRFSPVVNEINKLDDEVFGGSWDDLRSGYPQATQNLVRPVIDALKSVLKQG